jgi:hypothetical protein
MSEQLDEYIKALMEQPTAQRRERDMALARQTRNALLAELEKSLPAGVPLHKRGFGVMGEEGA